MVTIYFGKGVKVAISTNVSRKNYDNWKLSFAKIFAEIGESSLVVDLEYVQVHIANEAEILHSAGNISEDTLKLIKNVLGRFAGITDTRFSYRPDSKYSHEMIYVIATVYGSFAGLLESVRKAGGPLRMVDDLMRVDPERTKHHSYLYHQKTH
ncbi:hypothetical protein NP552_15655 [Pseudomonas sp. 8209]|uniref:hypothetical protein n=1 Tax=Pseudomonas sp. 8209 TaxID=2967214 RepID=UPI002363C68D|nr:hypothetical protein [Pseudomonas sp. 8209]MDD1956479.1 hypothetical protein [Pseudomonas sp. 8209]